MNMSICCFFVMVFVHTLSCVPLSSVFETEHGLHDALDRGGPNPGQGDDVFHRQVPSAGACPVPAHAQCRRMPSAGACPVPAHAQ